MKSIVGIQGRPFWSAAALGFVPLLIALASPAHARPLTQPPPEAFTTAQRVEPVAALVEESEDDLACHQTRRRLWVDGEGWIIRRVTLCR